MPVVKEIHLAYSYSPKYRTYYCKGYVRETGHPGNPGYVYKTTSRCALGDTREEAEKETLSRVIHNYDMTGGAKAFPVVNHGRMPHILVEGMSF